MIRKLNFLVLSMAAVVPAFAMDAARSPSRPSLCKTVKRSTSPMPDWWPRKACLEA
ncbi:MAG: hypothetical protein V4794_04100 [Pseudomonadota bacterium]|uniref:hypothetical protein n=1 Tax=Hydrogenophaga sp. TaxID=1904254 RepID=UPI0033500F27